MDYKDFILEAYMWQGNRPRFIIEQLMPDGNSDYGVIAGRYWLGKTNLSLELLVCLATGKPFFGLRCERTPVIFLDFEGNKFNITERLEKILKRYPTPQENYLNIKNLKDNRFRLNGNIDRLVDAVGGAKFALIDGTKHLIGGDYLKPNKVKQLDEDLLRAMQKGDFSSAITWQVRKPHKDTLIVPGDLNELKGAADLVEDATFALLLEKEPPGPIGRGKWNHPPDTHVNLYIGKAKEANVDFKHPYRELNYCKDSCEFKLR